MPKKDLKELLGGARVIRKKISFNIVLENIAKDMNYSPMELQTKQTIDTVWFRLSKIEKIISDFVLERNFKVDAYKKAIEKLHLDKSKSDANAKVIDEFIKEINDFNDGFKQTLQKEVQDVKEKFHVFLGTDLSKTEKLKVVKQVTEALFDFITEQLEKEREVQTPLGKYTVKTNKRFNTKSVSFDENRSLKDYLLGNSDKNIEEIDKQKKIIQTQILDKDKHFDRLKLKKGN